jgi:hypothetical protein
MSKFNAFARVLNQKVMDFQWMNNLNMTAYNILAQTIKKNIYVPDDVLEIIFVVAIYQKWEFF